MPTKARNPIARTPFSRVFVIEGGAGPGNSPDYLDYARSLANAWPQGDITPVRVPSRDAYDEFDVVDSIQGQQGLPGNSIEFRSIIGRSKALDIVRKRCLFDVQIHQGKCADPTDFNGGWEVIWVYEEARATAFSTTELGAMDSGQNASVMETLPFTAQDLYQILRLTPQQVGATQITDEVIDVIICDSKSCGECGISSDGCQVSFALINDNSGSPGLPAEVEYTEDGWATVNSTHVSTLGLAQSPSALICVGTYLVVISNASGSVHYAPIADILDAGETWTQVTTGFITAGKPNDGFSLGATKTWIVGDGGYVYFTEDITAGVSVQTAGGETAQNLNSIHGADDQYLVAVGASNAVIATQNGGVNWVAVTGPAAGVVLNAVFMQTRLEWWVAAANGNLYYTKDGGDSWTAKAFPGSGAGNATDVVFASSAVGYLAHATATPRGRVLRTIDGGNSWYVLPEGNLTFPLNDRINAIAACPDDVNVAYAGGLADDAQDGILVKLG